MVLLTVFNQFVPLFCDRQLMILLMFLLICYFVICTDAINAAEKNSVKAERERDVVTLMLLTHLLKIGSGYSNLKSGI